MKRIALLLVVFILAPRLLSQTTSAAAIQGILVRWGTDEPVGQATIELRDGSGRPVAITATKDSGEFMFTNVARGTYGIVAMAAGFAPAEYGQLRPGGSGRQLSVVSGDPLRVRIGISSGGSISGRVMSESGQPMVYSVIQILKATYGSDGRVIPEFKQSVTTNDLGEYRAFWLPPGQYIVRAGNSQLNCNCNHGTINPMGSDTITPTFFVSQTNRPRAGAAPSESPPGSVAVRSFFYSGAADATSATPVDVQAGREVTGVDIRVAPIEFSSRVQLRGVVLDLSGRPLQDFFNVSIAKYPVTAAAGSGGGTAQVVTTRAATADPNDAAAGRQRYVVDNGKFEGSAGAGTYQIRVNQGELSGRTIVDIGNRDIDVTIPLQPSAVVNGRVRVEGDAADTVRDWSKFQVGVWTSPSFSFQSAIGVGARFQIEHVLVGDYQFFIPPWTTAPVPRTDRQGLALPPVIPDRTAVPAAFENAYVKSIRAGNDDLLEMPLRIGETQPVPEVEIVVSFDAASLAGRVMTAGNLPVSRATVVVLPKGTAAVVADRHRSAISDDAGRFDFRGLPPGDYRLFAWEDVDAGAWFNPSFLVANERFATSIALTERQRQTIDIKVIPASAMQ